TGDTPAGSDTEAIRTPARSVPDFPRKPGDTPTYRTLRRFGRQPGVSPIVPRNPGTRLRIGHCGDSDASPECPRFFRFFLYGKAGTRLLDRTLRRFGRQPGVPPIFSMANQGTRLPYRTLQRFGRQPGVCPRLLASD